MYECLPVYVSCCAVVNQPLRKTMALIRQNCSSISNNDRPSKSAMASSPPALVPQITSNISVMRLITSDDVIYIYIMYVYNIYNVIYIHIYTYIHIPIYIYMLYIYMLYTYIYIYMCSSCVWSDTREVYIYINIYVYICIYI